MEGKPKIDFGVIGGSGLYKFEGLENIRVIEIDTPFGSPSSPITIGNLGNVTVGFLARHGYGHTLTPSEVNYRANIYALKAIGAKKVVAISACGSLREDFVPGDLVIPHQLFDFTKSRINSFFGEKFVAHVGVADPFCPDFSDELFSALRNITPALHRGGSAITVEGPRFSTKAESQIYRSWGLDLIGMTTSPEAFLAKEAELCYGVIYHVTDYDVWHQTEDPVSVEQIFQIINKNTSLVQEGIKSLAENYHAEQKCECPNALQHAFTTAKSSISDKTLKKLSLLVEKYDLQQ